MFFKRFDFQVLLRITLLTLSIFLCVYLLMTSKLYVTITVCCLAILFQIYIFFKYIERTNQYMTRFLEAVKHGDFSQTFSGEELGSSFKEMITLLNDVMKKMKQTRSEKEEHYRYLQTVVHHVGIGLIVFQRDGEIQLLNTAAKRILKVTTLKNIGGLETISSQLSQTLLSIGAGEKALVKIYNGEMELALHAAEFKLKDRAYTLVSFHNIQSELQEKEMEAWQTLIRVLTHEIMNSMTPITSMADTLLQMLNSAKKQSPPTDSLALTIQQSHHTTEHYEANDPENETNHPPGIQIDGETMEDIDSALKTIYKRSQGLTHFVSAYRNLTLIPKPVFKHFAIAELFQRIEKLMENKIKKKNIDFSWSIEPQTLELTADPGLIEQVLINLVLNATDALKDTPEPCLRLDAKLDEFDHVNIKLTDNGPGIIPQAIDKVFIPFFTTKKKGSGIGLSLSRQIMKSHEGTINVRSVPDEKTVFTLKF